MMLKFGDMINVLFVFCMLVIFLIVRIVFVLINVFLLWVVYMCLMLLNGLGEFKGILIFVIFVLISVL